MNYVLLEGLAEPLQLGGAGRELDEAAQPYRYIMKMLKGNSYLIKVMSVSDLEYPRSKIYKLCVAMISKSSHILFLKREIGRNYYHQPNARGI
jgi:hypothetical protein